jgi:hypothetical protein
MPGWHANDNGPILEHPLVIKLVANLPASRPV